MRVEHVMSTPAHSCLATDSLHTAAEIMWQADCGCVPVTDEGQHLVGIVTDRDICMAAHKEGEALREYTVADVMMAAPRACTPEASLREVAETMAERRVRRLPVVDRDSRLVGIVSLSDLALAALRSSRQETPELGAEDIGMTLATICQAPANSGSAEPR